MGEERYPGPCMAFHITAATMLQAPFAWEMFSFTSSDTLDCDTLPASLNRKLAIGVPSVAPIESIRLHSTSAYVGSAVAGTRTNSTRDPPCTMTIRSAVGSWATRSPRRSGRPSPACSASLANERNKLRITDGVPLPSASTFFFAGFFTWLSFPFLAFSGPRSAMRRFSSPLTTTANGRKLTERPVLAAARYWTIVSSSAQFHQLSGSLRHCQSEPDLIEK